MDRDSNILRELDENMEESKAKLSKIETDVDVGFTEVKKTKAGIVQN